MSMNCWNFSGDLLGYGRRGSEKFPKIWLRVRLPSARVPLPTDKDDTVLVQENILFVNIDLPQTEAGSRFEDAIKTANYIFVHNATMAAIKRSKKLPNGTWDTTDVRGIKAKINSIAVYDKKPPDINKAVIHGKVVKQQDNVIVVEERYRNVATGEWLTREIPLVSSKDLDTNLPSKYVTAFAQLLGVTRDGVSKVYGVADLIIRM